MVKQCAKCKESKNVSQFSKLSRASDGLNYRCKVCCSEYYNSLYPRIKESKKAYAKTRYLNNRVELIDKAKSSYDSSKKKLYNQKYNVINRIKINESKNAYEKNRVLNDPDYRLVKRMRKVVYRLIKNKKEPTFSILGYSKKQLIGWLGRYPDINESIDHRVPVSWFTADAPIRIVSHYRNLQILKREDNSKKANKYSHPIDFDYYTMAINFIKDKYKNKVYYHGR